MAERGNERAGAFRLRLWSRRLFPWSWRRLTAAVLVVGGLAPLGLGGCAPAADPSMPDFVQRASPPVREAYAYAVENPEVLSHLPCYCGCVYHGDTNNEECFINERLSDGTVAFDPHAAT